MGWGVIFLLEVVENGRDFHPNEGGNFITWYVDIHTNLKMYTEMKLIIIKLNRIKISKWVQFHSSFHGGNG